MTDDAALLRRYAQARDERAFAELVRRHLGLVYHAALRQCGGDAHRAEDVAQAVFTDLARKAEKLASRPVLAGWLYTSTRYAAAQAVRGEARRQVREQEAHVMNEILSDNSAEAVAEWEKLRPQIDDALHALGERDREAVLLRFFEGRAFAEVGAKLSLSEDAARMRVERALEKLRTTLVRRGITSTSAALGLALANQATAVVPAGVVASVTGAALAGATAGATWLAIFTMSKIKVGVVSAVLLAGLATVAVDVHANRGLHAELRALQAGGEDAVALAKDAQRLNTALQKLGASNPEAGELARLRQRAAVLATRPASVVDGEMISAASWSDVGRATPEAANLTFHWAMFNRDLDTVAKFVSFDDDTPENREAFMAHFSPAVRAKYRTPERLLAAAVYGAGTNAAQSPDDAFQFLEMNDQVGGNGSRFGQKRVRVWYRMASGREFEGSTRWQQTPDGWLPAPFTLTKEWKFAVPEFDAASGDRLPPRTPGENAPAKK